MGQVNSPYKKIELHPSFQLSTGQQQYLYENLVNSYDEATRVTRNYLELINRISTTPEILWTVYADGNIAGLFGLEPIPGSDYWETTTILLPQYRRTGLNRDLKQTVATALLETSLKLCSRIRTENWISQKATEKAFPGLGNKTMEGISVLEHDKENSYTYLFYDLSEVQATPISDKTAQIAEELKQYAKTQKIPNVGAGRADKINQTPKIKDPQ